MTDDDYVRFLCELMGSVGPVVARRMFGGHGLYRDGLMLGLVADGRLYLKVDAISAADFEAARCAPFVYAGKGRPITMSYWSVPDEALDAVDAMAPWVARAAGAAGRIALLRNARGGAQGRSRKPGPPRAPKQRG